MSIETESAADPGDASNPEFQDLLQRAQHRDKDATDTFVERYGDILVRIIRRHYIKEDSELRSRFDSKDLAQETWMEMFQQIAAGRPIKDDEEFKKILGGILRQEFLNQYRTHVLTEKRSQKREEAPGGAEECDVPVAEADPATLAELQDECRQLLDEAESPGQRQLMLAILDGAGTSEAAKLMKISVRHVQRILRHIRRHAKMRRAERGD